MMLHRKAVVVLVSVVAVLLAYVGFHFLRGNSGSPPQGPTVAPEGDADILRLCRAARQGDREALKTLVRAAGTLTCDQREAILYGLVGARIPVSQFACAALEAGLTLPKTRAMALIDIASGPATPEARMLAVKHLSDPDRVCVLDAAAMAAGSLRVAEAIPYLLKELEYDVNRDGEKLPPPVLAIVKALGEIGDPMALPGLERYLKRLPPSSDMARATRRAIKQIKGEHPDYDPKQFADRVRAITSLPEQIRIDGRKLSIDEAASLLIEQLRSPDARVSARASTRLARIAPRLRGTRHYRELKRILDDPSQGARRYEALCVLICAGGPEAKALVTRALADSDPVMRRVAQEAQADSPAALVGSNVADVSSAVKALEGQLRDMLASEDVDERMDALDQVGKLGPRLMGRPIVQDLERMFEESHDTGMRVRLLGSILWIMQKGGREWYERGLADPNWQIRRKANSVGAIIGWPRVADEDVARGPIVLPDQKSAERK